MMKVKINNGRSIIRNLTDGFAHCLFIGTPCTLNWPDCGGGEAEYYTISNCNVEASTQVTGVLNDVLLNGSDDDTLERITTFLELFSNGEYTIGLGPISLTNSTFFHDESGQWASHVPMDERFTGWFFPSSEKWDYFFTKPYKTIDRKRVEYYKGLITAGLKPKIVIYQIFYSDTYSGGPAYVIDGHHKILAYLDLNMDVEAVYIHKDVSENEERIEDLLPLVYSFLKPHELRHIAYNNPKIYMGNDEFTNLASEALDYKLRHARHNIDSEVVSLMAEAANSTNKEHFAWLSHRMQSLERNRNIGKGLYLYAGAENGSLKPFPVNSRADLQKWLAIIKRG